MQAPTIGRVALYYPTDAEVRDWNMHDDAPCRADVCYVHPDNSVNLMVNDHDGHPRTKTGVPFTDDGKPGTAGWMAYQRDKHALEVNPAQGFVEKKPPAPRKPRAAKADPTEEIVAGPPATEGAMSAESLKDLGSSPEVQSAVNHEGSGRSA